MSDSNPDLSARLLKRMEDMCEYRSCHEAGHTIVRTLIGDIVGAVHSCEDPSTEFKFQEWKCECGGSVRNLTPDEYKKREGSGTETCPEIKPPKPDCRKCREYLIKHIAAQLAGDVATGALGQKMHLRESSTDDFEKCECLLDRFGVTGPSRTEFKNKGRRLAKQLVSREEKAVRAVRDELVIARGELDGKRASEIVRANLTSSEVNLEGVGPSPP